MAIEYALFGKEDAEALSRFSKQFLDPRHPSLRRSLEPEYYLWRNYRNPAGEGTIILARDNQRLVGCFGITPKRVTALGRPWLCAEMDDAFVDPLFQGQGIFRKMVEMAAGEAVRQGIRFLYGTPNEVSCPIFLHRLGFEEVPACHVWLVVSVCAPFRMARPVEWKAASQDNPRPQAFEVVHDADYLHWRFRDNPDDYQWIGGDLVLKAGMWGARRIGYLADQLSGRGDRLRLLRGLQAARRYFARQGFPMVAGWVQTSILSRRSLWAHGFAPCYRKPVVFRSLDSSFHPRALTEVRFLMGDSDNI